MSLSGIMGERGLKAARKRNPQDAKQSVVEVVQSGLAFKAEMRSGMLAGLLSLRRYLRQGWVGEVLWSVTRDNFCVSSVDSFYGGNQHWTARQPYSKVLI